jgi:hypothetical protein
MIPNQDKERVLTPLSMKRWRLRRRESLEMTREKVNESFSGVVEAMFGVEEGAATFAVEMMVTVVVD